MFGRVEPGMEGILAEVAFIIVLVSKAGFAGKLWVVKYVVV